MKKIAKILFFVATALIVVVGALVLYVNISYPNVGDATDMKIEPTPERLERGAYLANSVMVCMDCHSSRDWNLFSGPLVAGTEGKGGEVFDQKVGFPGRFTSKNITPAHLGQWTDGEIFRAITSGVSKDGSPLFPVMPHPNYGRMDEEDIKSVIVYLRSLKPIENFPEASVADFPMNIIAKTIPQKANLQPKPDTTDLVKYGNYLVVAASCGECHTKQDKGKVVGAPFAGGMEFPFPDGAKVVSSNITPHESGIGRWDEAQFVNKFKSFDTANGYQHVPVSKGQFQTVMPWAMYGQMTPQDLKAIFAYLKTLQPVENVVVKYKPAA